jgi:hypothetical protein
LERLDLLCDLPRKLLLAGELRGRSLEQSLNPMVARGCGQFPPYPLGGTVELCSIEDTVQLHLAWAAR